MRTVTYTITQEDDGKRVDRFLVFGQGVSRKVVIALKKLPDGMLKNGEHVRTIDILHTGDILEINLPESGRSMPTCDIPVPIVYEDEDLIIFDKPQDMPVHQSGGHIYGTLDGVYAHICSERGTASTFRAINRLDKDTSGAVLVAKNQIVAGQLWKAVSKVYVGIVYGSLEKDSGMINLPISREVPMEMRRVICPDGQEAITEYHVIARGNTSTLVKFILHTGRTHQIRVHMSDMGHYLLGDSLYGEVCEGDKFTGQALHCHSLSFTQPITKQEIHAIAPYPQNFIDFFAIDGYNTCILN